MTIPIPEPVAWITNESLYGLKSGRTNSKGAVPVHASRSYVAKTPLITTTQAEAYKDACVREALEQVEQTIMAMMQRKTSIRAADAIAATRALIPQQ